MTRRLLLLAALSLPSPARAADFAYTLKEPALTSAAVVDAQTHRVTPLWSLRPTPAGRQTFSADLAPHQRITIIANRATYTNVGAIGNSGRTPDAAGHTPTNIEAVAVDKDGNVYTANGWDEAGADFKKWDKDGNAVYDAKFQIRNGRPNGAPYAICVDEEYLYCAVGGWDREPWNNRQQIQRFRLSDGKAAPFTGPSETSSTDEPKGDRPPRVGKGPSKTLLDGHIQLYEWPELLIPKDTPEPRRIFLRQPIRALDVAGSTLYAADALAGVVRMYDTETGASKGDFPVGPLPRALAVDPIGQVWVADADGSLRAYNANSYAGVSYSGLGDVTAMAFGPGAKLYIADSKSGQILTLNNSPDTPGNFTPILGQKATPGDRAPDHFFILRGVAVDNAGNLITIQREPGPSGARLAKWTLPQSAKTYSLAWEHLATEFVSLGNYGQSDPDTFYTATLHRHRLLDRAKGTWDYLGNATDLAAFPTSDHTYRSDPHGVPRVLRIGQADFLFLPTGDGVQVYRADGNVLKLAALVGGHDPGPTGDQSDRITKWAWSDEKGTVKPDPAQIRTLDDRYTCFGMDVDAHANLWFANTHTHSIWTLPLAGLDSRGNPRYDWRLAREVTPRDTSELAFDPAMVQAVPDGSFYAFGWSKPHPQPRNNPFWMGGTTLARFDARGKLLWWTPLPETCVGMDALPAAKPSDSSAGVIVGGGKSATLYHYTPGGLLIGKLSPGPAMANHSGWLDNHASVAANRDPRDGLLDVFAEDDYTCRIAWYRLDDRAIETLNVQAVRP